MKKRMIALAAFAMIVAAGAMANEPRGTEVVTFPIVNSQYNPCVNEIVENSIIVEARRHTFETPSGALIFLDHWTFYAVSVGQSSGTTWIGSGPGPAVSHVRQGETYTELAEYRFRPEDGKGTSWIYSGKFHLTFNANGELVAYIDDTADLYRCLDKK